MGIALIILALLVVWWVEKHPDLDPGIAVLVFVLSWTTGLVGIYITMKTFWA